MAETSYPEHDKLQAMQESRDAMQRMLEYLMDECGYTLCKWQDARSTDSGELEENVFARQVWNEETKQFELPMRRKMIYDPEGYYPAHVSREAIMAGAMGIDADKIEAEKRQMLDEIRAANRTRNTPA